MRIVPASAAIFLALVAVAGATGANWPIMPFVDLPAAQTIGPDGARATVRIRLDDDASAIDVEVYGLDGLRVGDDNHVQIRRGRMQKGGVFAFDVTVHPGRGRSYLVVSAKAHFAHAGLGGTLRSFPYGEESAEQKREHTRCVRQDPEGVWIRLPECEEAAPPKAETQIQPPPPARPSIPPLTLSIGEFRASPPVGRTARIVGYVVESYRCPPCPKGAMCKPCASRSAIFLAEAPSHAPIALDRPPADVVAVTTPHPEQFESGAQYRVELAVTDRRLEHFDGRLLRSQRPDREPVWTDDAL